MNNNITDLLAKMSFEYECEETPILTMDVQLKSGKILHGAEILKVKEKRLSDFQRRGYFMVQDFDVEGVGCEEIELGEYLKIKEIMPGKWMAFEV
jgi:hypothetical protein